MSDYTLGLDEITADDVLDSRAIIARIEYLTLSANDDTLTSEEASELSALIVLDAEASQYAEDWEYGVTLVRDDYFTEYAREFAIDCGFELPESNTWPGQFVTIDWDAAAESLQEDYSEITYDGVTYWVR